MSRLGECFSNVDFKTTVRCRRRVILYYPGGAPRSTPCCARYFSQRGGDSSISNQPLRQLNFWLAYTRPRLFARDEPAYRPGHFDRSEFPNFLFPGREAWGPYVGRTLVPAAGVIACRRGRQLSGSDSANLKTMTLQGAQFHFRFDCIGLADARGHPIRRPFAWPRARALQRRSRSL
jgi:hypothetical protein